MLVALKHGLAAPKSVGVALQGLQRFCILTTLRASASQLQERHNQCAPLSTTQSINRACAYWRQKALDYPRSRMHGKHVLMLCSELLVIPAERLMEELLLLGLDLLEGLAST